LRNRLKASYTSAAVHGFGLGAFFAGLDLTGFAADFAGFGFALRMILAMIAVYWQAMTSGSNAFDPDAPQPELFSALLTPHRSLNRTGFLVLMGFVCAISFIAGLVFLMMGAWPVFGFFGLDVLAIWWAFRINFRTGRASEEIRVTPSELRIRRTSHRGHVVEWVLNPLWVRLEQTGDPEFGIDRLWLVSRGRLVSVGSFLGPEEKASFAKALLAALLAAKRGPTYNPLT
jgi:uncharacterized membrane protein